MPIRHLLPVHIILAQKGWQALSGFITAIFVTQFLTGNEQGFYYAFGSLLSGYVLLDLGLSGLLVQVSARMFHGLSFRGDGSINPEGSKRDQFIAMVIWGQRWYLRAGSAALLLMPVGFWYFSSSNSSAQSIEWQWPWVFIVVSVAISMPAYPRLSIIEGAGNVSEVYLVRLCHYAVGALLAWILLASGAGLYAPAMAPFSVVVVVYLWWHIRYRPAFLADKKAILDFPWMEEVWPLQRRVAVSWFASYLLLYSPTLIVFYFQDATTAGQLGLSIVVANVLGSLCASWLTAKVPRITHMTVSGEVNESYCMFMYEFRRALQIMIAAYVVGIISLMVIENTLFAQRVLPITDVIVLFLLFSIFHSVGMLSVYFRAHGREVLAWPAMLGVIVSIFVSVLVVHVFGVTGVLLSFLFVYGTVCIISMWLAWKRQSMSNS